MEVIREIRRALSKEITMTVPDEFIDEDIEITIRKIATELHPPINKVKSDFNAFRLNTRGFVFNREEAHER
jgi:hypothetical protein